MSGKFEPKQKVELDPPKDDPIDLEYLAKCDGPWRDTINLQNTCGSILTVTGTHEGFPTYVAIKGTIFDVTGNKAYAPGASYSGQSHCHVPPRSFMVKHDSLSAICGHARDTANSVDLVFAGKDASRALAQSSLKKEECRPEWEDLSDEHKKVLNDWFTFFSKRYNVKGKVAS